MRYLPRPYKQDHFFLQIFAQSREEYLSNRLRINAVVLLVCADEPDVHDPIRIKDN